MTNNRPPAVSGAFYPSAPAQLSRDIDRYLRESKSHTLSGDLVALLVPHAGYTYSGAVAGEGFRQLKGGWKTVVLLGPAHHLPVKGAALWSKGVFQTPLGPVPVDEALAQKLLAGTALVRDMRAPHEEEHSLEVELPFLQKTLGKFQIVPLLLNTDDPEVCRHIGQAIGQIIRERIHGVREQESISSFSADAGGGPIIDDGPPTEALGGDVLIVISSDLSHYPDRQTASRVDRTSLAALERMDTAFLRLSSRFLLRRGEPELYCAFCGESALWAGMEAAKILGADQAQILRYNNSADVPEGQPDRVVGYAAVAFVNRNPAMAVAPERFCRGPMGPPPTTAGDDVSCRLDRVAEQALLRAARTSIKEELDGGKYEPLPLSDNPEFNLPAAVFVTLWLRGQLQGCIGSIEPSDTLLESVRRLARDSAFEDPRTIPLRQEDFAAVRIAISILSRLERVSGPEAIEPGRHGVVLRKGSRTGLFLPDVWENLPAKEDFLSVLCEQKLGVDPGAWKKPDVTFDVFTTTKIEEPAGKI
jgi:AmmeMemoRadiSam system protein A